LQLGREAFIHRVWEWKKLYGGAIKDQMKRLGASVDWGREYFTMDDNLSRAVREAFVRLYEEGLIYRGKYIVNWCPRCMTAISDLEVVHEDVPGKLYHIRYPVVGSEQYLVVATTRPETMLGDTAVAVNARDERYTHLHNKRLQLPLTDRQIPIILDDIANPEFGTGAVKIHQRMMPAIIRWDCGICCRKSTSWTTRLISMRTPGRTRAWTALRRGSGYCKTCGIADCSRARKTILSRWASVTVARRW